MTRLQQARARQAKCRRMQERLEATLDLTIPTLDTKPSAAFEAVLVYASEGLWAQGIISTHEDAIYLVMGALSKTRARRQTICRAIPR